MKNKNRLSYLIRTPLLMASVVLGGLMGCSSADVESTSGYIMFYNASANAPDIFLTVDEDINNDEDDGHVERTYYGVGFGQSSGALELISKTYATELAWQDQDSSAREDLEIFERGEVNITTNNTQLVVLSGDILAPQVHQYNIELIDDSNDATESLFNVRFLNMSSWGDSINVYISRSDQTFLEAELLGQFNFSELSQNLKYSQDSYIYYITSAQDEQLLYQSDEVSYGTTSQYLMVIRDNLGVDSSPITLDWIRNSSAIEYPNAQALAQFKVFNAIELHQQFPNYQGEFDFNFGTSEQSKISGLSVGHLSEVVTVAHGDYSVALTTTNTSDILIENQLLTLGKNLYKTIFYYLSEQAVDLDNDGNVDEDGDGIVDEVEAVVKSFIVDNSLRESIYDHQINIVNLIDSDDFSQVKFYFVKSDELIDTASDKKTVSFASDQSIILINNTYTVYALAQVNGNDTILATTTLTLDESSNEMFLILDQEQDLGIEMTFLNQN